MLSLISDKMGSKRRSSDIISLLVSIYGSKDIFINEYRDVLADRLLHQHNYNTARSAFCSQSQSEEQGRHFRNLAAALCLCCVQGDSERGAAEAEVRGVSHALLRGDAEGNVSQIITTSVKFPEPARRPFLGSLCVLL